MNDESARFLSFFSQEKTWPYTSETHPFCTPEELASNGFFFHPGENYIDMCECFCCGIKLRDWEETDVPREEHLKHNPSCPFILNPSNTNNIPKSKQKTLKDILNNEDKKEEEEKNNLNLEEHKHKGQFVSDIFFSLINPQSEWQFFSEDENVVDNNTTSIVIGNNNTSVNDNNSLK
ncbi:hypothetical protein ABK040_016299 [Willaertia magna]